MTGSNHSRSRSPVAFPNRLLGRLFLLAAILGIEVLALAAIPHSGSLLGPFAPFGIVFFAAFVGLGYSTLKAQRQHLRFGGGYLAGNLACIAAICAGNIAALHGYSFLQFSHGGHFILIALTVIGIVLLVLACVSLQACIETLRVTRHLWLYAALAGALAWCLRYPFQSFWDASTSAPGRVLQIMTFHSVKTVLQYFLPNIAVDASTFTIGTPRFSIIVAEFCSGMEGLGLVLAFTIIWLWYFRRESRFPQALLLIPCALACVWTLNILRISALVLIGNAGAPDVAMVGFHSQAGWIAFTAVAFAFSMATRKLRWVRRIPDITPGSSSSPTGQSSDSLAPLQEEAGESPATGAYLVPFLAILGATFLSKAASGYFEWLYPLRFVAAILALWHYRAQYFGPNRKLNWSFGWLAPLAGTVIFLVWIVPSLYADLTVPSPVASGLAALSPASRWTWIAFRVLAASITVPIAEELAFRGYLARRFIGREFDTIPFSRLTVLSIGLSSVAFGLMHGRQWIVGILAGAVFALVLKWRGRIGDAVVAHATSNILLAIWVLARGDWSQW